MMWSDWLQENAGWHSGTVGSVNMSPFQGSWLKPMISPWLPVIVRVDLQVSYHF